MPERACCSEGSARACRHLCPPDRTWHLSQWLGCCQAVHPNRSRCPSQGLKYRGNTSLVRGDWGSPRQQPATVLTDSEGSARACRHLCPPDRTWHLSQWLGCCQAVHPNRSRCPSQGLKYRGNTSLVRGDWGPPRQQPATVLTDSAHLGFQNPRCASRLVLFVRFQGARGLLSPLVAQETDEGTIGLELCTSSSHAERSVERG